MNSRPSVMLLGDLIVDISMELEAYPALGEEVMARQASFHPGGGVANTACVLAKLGILPRLYARVGSDPLGDYLLNEYTRAGIDLSGVTRDAAHPTGLIFIPTVPGGERTMFSSRGANVFLSPADVPESCLSGVDLLQLTGYAFLGSPQREAAWKAINLAQARGILISMDVALDPVIKCRDDILRLLGSLAICVLGQEEAAALLGTRTPEESARVLLERGVSTAAIKLGSRGSYFADREHHQFIPALPVRSVDATGAGDAFAAGLIFARLAGLNLPASGMLASALGALATTVFGAGPSLPGGSELLGFLVDLKKGGGYPEYAVALASAMEALVQRTERNHGLQD